jgi:hypothetical protein
MRSVVLAAACTCALASTGAAQRVSAWLDANAAHSRPPAGTTAEAASYGLLGVRVRAEGLRSAFELAASTGRGAAEGTGGWLSGRLGVNATRVRGIFDYGARAEAAGLTYIADVQINASDTYRQSLVSASVRPHAGVSIAGMRLGAEALFTRGYWNATVESPLIQNGPGLPLPGRDDVQRRSVESNGDVQILGGTTSLLRVIGPATVELRASSYEAANQVADGRYSGIDGNVALSVGEVDVTAGARRWNTPVDGVEYGGHAGLGIAVGNSAYLQGVVSRSISDPLYGVAGDLAISVGVSVSLGRRSIGPPAPATLGAASGRGRVVRFVFARADARSVAVAGDFSEWEPRAMQRDAKGVWILETVLPPGVYHYSFVVNGETWTVPANAPGLVDDGFGQKNATLVVTAAG